MRAPAIDNSTPSAKCTLATLMLGESCTCCCATHNHSPFHLTAVHLSSANKLSAKGIETRIIPWQYCGQLLERPLSKCMNQLTFAPCPKPCVIIWFLSELLHRNYERRDHSIGTVAIWSCQTPRRFLQLIKLKNSTLDKQCAYEVNLQQNIWKQSLTKWQLSTLFATL